MIGQNTRRRPVQPPPEVGASMRPTGRWDVLLPNTLDVLVATKYDRRPAGLDHLPTLSSRTIASTVPGWAKAANAVLDQAEHDALFVDDDIELTPSTFDLLARYWDRAEVFGFTLLIKGTEGLNLASAGYVFGAGGTLMPQVGVEILLPAYVAHVTASCMVVKKEVLDAGIRFPDWPGLHSEDVAFTLDCWLQGFRVAYLPGVAYHHIGEGGMGNTKQGETDRIKKLGINKMLLAEWMTEHKIGDALAAGRVPFGGVPL